MVQQLDVVGFSPGTARRRRTAVTTGLLDATGVDEATLYFRAFCDGLAGLELDAFIPVGTGEHL